VDESRSVRFLGLLRTLLRHGVVFCVVGGVAAQLEGAPVLTLDLDVLYDKSADNLGRLLGALRELKAHYRDPAGRHIEPDMAKLGGGVRHGGEGLARIARTPVKSMTTATVRGRVWVRFIATGLAGSYWTS
jgi:hypothetical protein